jgi:hypothetical protein
MYAAVGVSGASLIWLTLVVDILARAVCISSKTAFRVNADLGRDALFTLLGLD